MKLEHRQLVLDTNILLFWLRGSGFGQRIRSDYDLGARRPRPIVPVVVAGELRSLVLQLGWGDAKRDAASKLLAELPMADISSDLVVEAYASLDHASRNLGRKMGKNDLWIAALASVQKAVVLTSDKDFDHLHPALVEVERVHLDAIGAPSGS